MTVFQKARVKDIVAAEALVQLSPFQVVKIQPEYDYLNNDAVIPEVTGEDDPA